MVAIQNIGSSELSYIYKIGLNIDSFLGLECWGKNAGTTCIVIQVISCLVIVPFTLAIAIVMCSLQESVWAVTSIPFCIFHLQLHLGQDNAW